jgi:hypothetical protein
MKFPDVLLVLQKRKGKLRQVAAALIGRNTAAFIGVRANIFGFSLH